MQIKPTDRNWKKAINNYSKQTKTSPAKHNLESLLYISSRFCGDTGSPRVRVRAPQNLLLMSDMYLKYTEHSNSALYWARYSILVSKAFLRCVAGIRIIRSHSLICRNHNLQMKRAIYLSTPRPHSIIASRDRRTWSKMADRKEKWSRTGCLSLLSPIGWGTYFRSHWG